MKSVSESIFAVDIQNAENVSAVYGVQDAKDVGIKEAWFRDAIFARPDLVVAPCRAAGLIDDDDWHPWAKEFPVFDAEDNPVGKIDVLLVSSSGHIGIIETKLSYNPERRREVLAQVFDYAMHISEMNIGDLPELPKDGEGRVVAERGCECAPHGATIAANRSWGQSRPSGREAGASTSRSTSRRHVGFGVRRFASLQTDR